MNTIIRIKPSSCSEPRSEPRNRAAQLRALSARVLRLQDDERRRIARELHDSTGQTLCALKLEIASLQGLVGAISKKFGHIFELLNQATAEIRTTSHLLHPPLLEEAGFASAAQ